MGYNKSRTLATLVWKNVLNVLGHVKLFYTVFPAALQYSISCAHQYNISALTVHYYDEFEAGIQESRNVYYKIQNT